MQTGFVGVFPLPENEDELTIIFFFKKCRD
jgi:hypothetical protein